MQLSQCGMEPGPDTRHPLSTQWLLQTQFCTGNTLRCIGDGSVTVTGRVHNGRRQGTALDESPVHHSSLCEQLWVRYLAKGCSDGVLTPSLATRTPSMFHQHWVSNQEPSASHACF